MRAHWILLLLHMIGIFHDETFYLKGLWFFLNLLPSPIPDCECSILTLDSQSQTFSHPWLWVFNSDLRHSFSDSSSFLSAIIISSVGRFFSSIHCSGWGAFLLSFLYFQLPIGQIYLTTQNSPVQEVGCLWFKWFVAGSVFLMLVWEELIDSLASWSYEPKDHQKICY